MKLAPKKAHENYETGIPTPLVSCTGRCGISTTNNRGLFGALATIATLTLGAAAAASMALETPEERQARLLRQAQAENQRLAAENRRIASERRDMRENPAQHLLHALMYPTDILGYEELAHCLAGIRKFNRADVLKGYISAGVVSKADAIRLVRLLPQYDRSRTVSWIARQ